LNFPNGWNLVLNLPNGWTDLTDLDRLVPSSFSRLPSGLSQFLLSSRSLIFVVALSAWESCWAFAVFRVWAAWWEMHCWVRTVGCDWCFTSDLRSFCWSSAFGFSCWAFAFFLSFERTCGCRGDFLLGLAA
jgi:hypothetical protein